MTAPVSTTMKPAPADKVTSRTLSVNPVGLPSKDASSTLTEQTGEVVDKIIYINNPNAAVQIKANNYNYDTAYAGMADHNPVVSEFTYTYYK